MALTGLALFAFVVGHMLGNLQIYLGPEALDKYAASLRNLGALLWVARLGLLACVALHILAAVQLQVLKNAARPVAYAKLEPIASTYASRTMIWSGPILLAFIIYHLLHFTLGTAHPNFQDGAVYRNVIAGFQVIPVSIAYIAAMAFLGMHLVHGVWSAFQSLGVANPRSIGALRTFAAASTAAIVIGNISIPLSVMLGVLR